MEIDKKRKIRVGHRSSASKLMNKVSQRLDDGNEVEDKQLTKQPLQILKEKAAMIRGLDNQLSELNQRGLKLS